jgi:hypothetical protein
MDMTIRRLTIPDPLNFLASNFGRCLLRPGMQLGLLGGSLACAAAPYPPLDLPDTPGRGAMIQRSMRLLATSTPEQRHTVRILFYGQSITEQKWAGQVEEDLRRRFPHANLVVENRALAGFASQLLLKTAETDIASFRPDLLIFHVYGAHDAYEAILRMVRERTTAEILLQTDHVTKPADLTEETDPAKLPPAGHHWDAFMNHHWLPAMARKYGAGLCDQRAVWKSYLTKHQLEPKALLSDNVHLNAHGEWLMAQCVKAWLEYDPTLRPSPAEQWVKTLEVGGDARWEAGRLRVEFEGSRVDVVCDPATSDPSIVLIDGRKPSEWKELRGFTRAVTTPAGKWPVKWPVIAPIRAEQPILMEDWTMEVTRESTDGKRFRFGLAGSLTGPDGEGSSGERFVSRSGRVVIEPDAWNVAYSLSLAGIKPVPESFTVKWKVEGQFADQVITPPRPGPGIESVVTVAHGLPNGRHVIEISGGDKPPIRAVRIHRPALGRLTP